MPLNPFPDPQTYKIIGAGMAAHAELGCGFLEKIYRCALSVEFERFGVPFAIEETLRINYKGRVLQDHHGRSEGAQRDHDQGRGPLLNYLKASGMRRGLILNFGATSFQHKRMVLG